MKNEFISGLIIKKPHANAPDFIKAKISIKRDDLIKFLQSKEDEWINADLKESRDGKYYCAIDTWKPNQDIAEDDDVKVEDIPF